jgi:hypothetical protein
MQFKALLLMATLAPLPAAAFGNLDCITIEDCDTSGCVPGTRTFAIDFNWADQTATVTAPDINSQLPWLATGETDDGVASVLEYGSSGDLSHALRIEASGLDITAYYTFSDPSATTWVGTCDVRQAA